MSDRLTRARERFCKQTVGVYFKNDDEDIVGDGAAKSILAALHDAHVAFTLECAKTMVANAGGVTFVDELTRTSRGMTDATTSLLEAAACGTREGRSKRVKMSVGRIWESTKAFQAMPKTATAAVAARLMRCATFVKDVSEELGEVGGDAEDAAPVGLDEDDLRYCDDDFDEEEIAVAKSLATYARACIALLKALILPTVKEKKAKLEALEPIVQACGEFQSAVEEIGAGAYPPQEMEELAENIAKALECGRKMYECVRDAEIGDAATEEALKIFQAASETASNVVKNKL